MKNDERRLTEAEERRKRRFEEKCDEMYREGYEKHNLFFSIIGANIYGPLLALSLNLLFLYIYYVINGCSYVNTLVIHPLLFTLFLLIAIVLHELIHGITFGIFASEGRKAIEFGVIWKALTPYCTCSSTLKKWQYVIGALMPTILLGFLPGMVAAATANLSLLIFSQILILAGGGDFLVVVRLLFHRPKMASVLYLDHPYECGLVAFVKQK